MAEDIEEALIKKYGSKTFFPGDNLLDKTHIVIPVAPALNSILGGGIPMGSFVVITGKPKIGKSTLCLHFAKQAQYKGMKIYYFNVEGRLKNRDLKGIPGLKTDIDNFEIIGSTKGNILAAEDYLDILLTYTTSKEKCVFIVDSISQLCSKSRRANEVGDRFRDDVPLMLADMTKRVSNDLPIMDNIVICITHLIANQGGQGRSMWNEASGQKVQYQADVKLIAEYSEAYKIGEQQVGQLVHWRCDSTALYAPPCQKTVSLLRYGFGIDAEYETLSMCIDIGVVDKKASWIILPDGTKCQGMEKARAYLLENPDKYKELTDKLHNMTGM